MALIHLDAGVVIALLDADDAHHPSARSAVAALVERGAALGMASSALAECLVGPFRAGDQAVRTVLDLVADLPIRVIPLDVDIATAAARLRAEHRSLRLPDALVIATAVRSAADELLTTDRRWPPADALGLPALRHL